MVCSTFHRDNLLIIFLDSQIKRIIEDLYKLGLDDMVNFLVFLPVF